jgi:hypothetical protein
VIPLINSTGNALKNSAPGSVTELELLDRGFGAEREEEELEDILNRLPEV